MTGTPGRALKPSELQQVLDADEAVTMAQAQLGGATEARAGLWAKLVAKGVQPSAIGNATGKTRGAIVQALAVRGKATAAKR